MSFQNIIEELTATDADVSPADCEHSSRTYAAGTVASENGAPEKPQDKEPDDADPDAGYLAHVAYQPDLRDLTDHDLIDCLRGSASVSGMGCATAETIRERLAFIDELNARGFPREAVVGAIIIGEVEGARQAKRRAAKQLAGAAIADAFETSHIKINQYGA